jgi:hypothetical protein
MRSVMSGLSSGQSDRSGNRAFRGAVSWIVSLALTITPLGAYSAPDSAAVDQQYAAAKARLDQYMKLVSALRDSIDRSEFELDALLDRLDMDADSIIQFVTEDIGFEQYPGLLRGAQGTLMSGAGNALDQAVLLATLLNDAAFDSRIVRGHLDEARVRVLLQQLGGTLTATPVDTTDRYRDVLSRMAQLIDIPDADIDTFVASVTKEIPVKSTVEYADAVAGRQFVLQQLQQAGAAVTPADVTAELQAEASDYFWVEYRDGPSDEWTPVHPAFGGAAVDLGDIRAEHVFNHDIPDALQQRFRVEFFVEQRTGDSLTATSLMGPWERPTANLVGKSLHFTNVPDALRSNADLDNPAKIAQDTRFLIPVFTVDGKRAAQSSVFDLSGVVLDAGTAGASGAGFFQTLGKKMEGALGDAGTLGGGPQEAGRPYRALSAQWVQFTRIIPGGREEVTRRYLIDRIGAQHRASGSTQLSQFEDDGAAIWKLASSLNFSVTSGRYPQSYVFDRYLERLQSAQPLFEQTLQLQFYPDKPVTFDAKQLENIVDSTGLLLDHAFDQVNTTIDGVSSYHYEPVFTLFRNEFAFDGKTLSSGRAVDIVSNSKRTLRRAGERIVYAADDNILTGTWATRLEELDIAADDTDQASYWSTRKAFQQAREQNLAFLTLAPQDAAKVDLIAGASKETREGILQDLSNGFHVIVPEKTTDSLARIGWWRVNTRTGETLGRINEGFGGEIVKYETIIKVVSLAVSVVLAIPGFVDCRNKKQNSGRMCSLRGCLQGAGIGVFVGTAIGYSVGLIAAALAAPGAIAVSSVGAFRYAHEAPEAIQIGIEIGVARGMDIANAVNAIPQVPNCIE